MLEIVKSNAPPERRRPVFIDLPLPPIGGKCWVMREKGIFVLEKGAGVLRTIACTHAGAGNLEALDGIPNEQGFFADEDMSEPQPPTRENWRARTVPGGARVAPVSFDDAMRRHTEDMKIYMRREGRPLYSANPVVMGSWMLDGGFIHGLTLRVAGGHESASAIASIVWQPFKKRESPSA